MSIEQDIPFIDDNWLIGINKTDGYASMHVHACWRMRERALDHSRGRRKGDAKTGEVEGGRERERGGERSCNAKVIRRSACFPCQCLLDKINVPRPFRARSTRCFNFPSVTAPFTLKIESIALPRLAPPTDLDCLRIIHRRPPSDREGKFSHRLKRRRERKREKAKRPIMFGSINRVRWLEFNARCSIVDGFRVDAVPAKIKRIRNRRISLSARERNYKEKNNLLHFFFGDRTKSLIEEIYPRLVAAALYLLGGNFSFRDRSSPARETSILNT